MDMATLEGALVAHENSDRLVDIAQTVGIGVCGLGIIVSSIALIYVGILLRVAATTLSKDMRTLMEQVSHTKIRLEQIEVTLGIERQSEGNLGANHAKGS
jgi:hypothetical protein